MQSVSAVVSMLKDLPSAARWSKMLQAGRDMVMDADSTRRRNQANVVQALATSSVQYERILAAMALRGCLSITPSPLEAKSAKTTGDDAVAILRDSIKALLLDESPRVHQLVFGPVLHAYSDEDLMPILDGLTLTCFSSISRYMVRNHIREGVLKTMFDRSRSIREPSHLKRDILLISGASPEVLNELVPTPLSQWTLPTRVLEGLSDHQPAWMLSRLVKQLDEAVATSASIPEGLSQNIQTTLYRFLCPRHQSNHRRGIDLMTSTLHRLGASTTVMSPIVHMALEVATVEVCKYVVKRGDVFRGMQLALSSRMWVRLQREHDLLLKMVDLELLPAVHRPRTFRVLPASVRRELFEHRRELFERSGQVVISIDILRALPDEATRHSEALRAFEHADLQGDIYLRLPYLGLLPYPQLLPLAQESLTSSKPELRIAAAEVVMESVRYHPEHLPAVLEYCEKRSKEQDPWRYSVFSGLCKVPKSNWATQDLCAPLGRMIEAGTKAVDFSESTNAAMQHLLVRMLDAHPEFALEQLLTLIHRNATFYGGDHLRQSSRASQKCFVLGVQPLMFQWLRKVKHSELNYFLGTLFDDVLRPLRMELQPFMVACLRSPNARLATKGFEMLYTFFPGEAVELVPSLVAKEPDWMLHAIVKRIVEVHLQGDVLEPFLIPVENFEGRFQTEIYGSSVDHYIHFSHMHLWTSSAQSKYANTLLRLIQTKRVEHFYQTRSVIQRLGRLPSVPLSETLATLVVEDAEDELQRNFSIRCLAYCSDAASLNLLAEAMNDGRSRDAVISIRRRLRNVQVERALELLSPILNKEKQLVTLQKEICRFVGDLADQRALYFLTEFASRDLHRDVFVALLRGLWNYLDEEPTWVFFEKAASDTRVDACIAVCSIPDEQMRKPWQQERFARLMVKLLQHERSEVQRSAISRIMSSSDSSLDFNFIHDALFPILQRREFTNNTTWALIKMPSLQANTFVQHVMQLASDILLRTVVEVLESSMRHASTQQRESREAIMSALITALLRERRQPSLAVQLVMCHSSPSYLINTFSEMESLGLLHPGAMGTAVRLISGNSSFLQGKSLEELEKVERDQLRAHAQPFMRRLGLALLVCVSWKSGWNSERRTALDRYRTDEDLWVSGDARMEDVAEE